MSDPTPPLTAEQLADRVDAALRRAGTEQQPVLLDALSWVHIRDTLRGLPSAPAAPLLPQLDALKFDVAADSKEPALELRCTSCDSTVIDVVAGDDLRPAVRAALTHSEECSRERVTRIDDLARDIRGIDGDHQLGAGALAERLVDAGWRR